MDEILRQSIITLRGMWRFRWLGLATAWAVGLIGVAVVFLIPDKYEASARIYVNTASILKPLMTGMTVQLNDADRIAALSRLVISRPNVEKLVQTVALDAGTKSKAEYEEVVDSATKLLKIAPSGKDLYTLTFRDVQPERAKRAVQNFASMFIESGQGGKSNDTDAAKKFVDEQIVIYEKKLQDAESRLKDFKLRNLGMTPGEGAGFFTRMSDASTQLSQAQLLLREAENSRDAYKRGLASEETGAVSGLPAAGPSNSELDTRIDTLKRNLDIMLLKYTESHPDVIGTQRAIRELEEQKRQLVIARKGERTPPIQSINSGPLASEQLKVSLAQSEASVASLRARVGEYSGRYNELKAGATRMPQLEAEFVQLNRDYDVNKKNYENLISRRESVSMSGDMQSVSGVADFRLVDPPRVSPNPVAPNRQLLFPLTLLLALAAGFAIAFIMMEIRPAFFDGRSLAEITGLPIAGAISTVASKHKQREGRRSVFRFLSGVGALLGAYIAGFLALTLLAARSV